MNSDLKKLIWKTLRGASSSENGMDAEDHLLQAYALGVADGKGLLRCETCKHWDPDVEDRTEGTCLLPLLKADKARLWPEAYNNVYTTADFGCTEWEQR